MAININDDQPSTVVPWHEGDAVEVRYPLSGSGQSDRASWPWLPGTIITVCGPDEWQVCVEARELATLEDGRPPRSNTPDHKLFYPLCYRDSSEIRSRAVPDERAEAHRWPTGGVRAPARVSRESGI